MPLFAQILIALFGSVFVVGTLIVLTTLIRSHFKYKQFKKDLLDKEVWADEDKLNKDQLEEVERLDKLVKKISRRIKVPQKPE